MVKEKTICCKYAVSFPVVNDYPICIEFCSPCGGREEWGEEGRGEAIEGEREIRGREGGGKSDREEITKHR